MQIAVEKKPADQAGLGCPADSAGLYVGAQQTLGTTFSQAAFLQTISTAFSQATFLQAIGATFGNTGFYQAIRTPFSDNRVGTSVGSEYRESEAKQELALHGDVLRMF